ncbi:uncharacterized protein LOC112051698 isoform X1 [Bicyclus anynana]|uniref:Uncharacterized protein LOC112051698 isoform X1 n=1 Tax=Bicyclus anynana TaxID=110368 RepID=A0ABM3LQ78_BICAN|nr:uncharacterized protein LOC112051698 isoform X1 [Bicyclus anynana]XP_052741190.1 uncharacterized protein LOC112051698 isoform X1 [Bicyclus anynana]
MLRLRPKPESDSSREWSCCFCFHVRTGTVLLGIWHLMLHLVALGFLAAITRDPRLLEEFEQDSLAISRNTPFGTHGTRDHNLVYHDIDVGALVTICTLAVTLMLIYGASRGKPTHLLPFFCLQIFDFAITVLTVTGYLCYLQSIHRLVQETKRVPWREELLALPPAALALIVLSFFMTAVLLKVINTSSVTVTLPVLPAVHPPAGAGDQARAVARGAAGAASGRVGVNRAQLLHDCCVAQGVLHQHCVAVLQVLDDPKPRPRPTLALRDLYRRSGGAPRTRLLRPAARARLLQPAARLRGGRQADPAALLPRRHPHDRRPRQRC